MNMFTRLTALLFIICGAVSAQQVEMTILSNQADINTYPGNDGLVGTGDDVVSSNQTSNNASAPNAMGSCCTAGSVQYNIPSAGCSGDIPIQRLLPGTSTLCETLGTQ